MESKRRILGRKALGLLVSPQGQSVFEMSLMLVVAGVLAFGFLASARTYWPFLAASYLMGAAAYWWQFRDESLQKPGLFPFLFPARVWLHRSSRQDCAVLLVNAALVQVIYLCLSGAGGGLGGLFDGTEGAAAVQRWDVLEKGFSGGAGAVPLVLYTIAAVLVGEFCYYVAHRLQHEVPALWEFHKTHHSAEVLTPLTFFRLHPVDFCLISLLTSAGALALGAGFVRLYPGEATVLQAMGINVVIFAFYLLGANLRHSHIWVSFWPPVSHVLLSPAQHQLHHSTNPKHFDKNYGSQLALFDWLFGSLYVPREREELTFGLGGKEDAAYHSLYGLYILPFAKALRQLRRRRKGKA